MGILPNYTLVAVSLFVFTGVMIEESGLGGALFNTLEIRLHRLCGHRLNLTQVRGVEGKDSIRLTQLNLLDNNCFCLISSWLRHF